MTDDFIKIVKDEYSVWKEELTKRINKKNQEINENNEMRERIHLLLQDEKVRTFANYIGYQELEVMEHQSLNDSLYDFLRTYMSNYEWDIKYINSHDKYPIYCFHRSMSPLYSAVTGRKIGGYDDQYWNLQQPGYSFGPSDITENGNKREEFRIKNIGNIIYPPDGESFENLNTFYRVQTEFVEEALKTSQKDAKLLLLHKYGKNR